MWVASVQREKHDKKEPLLDDGGVEASCTSPRNLRAVPCPLGLATIKDSSRFYGLGSDGRVDPRMTAESLNSQAERLFAGFT